MGHVQPAASAGYPAGIHHARDHQDYNPILDPRGADVPGKGKIQAVLLVFIPFIR